jgi:glutamine synthetase
LGHTPKFPSRNRTILVSLIRDLENPMATRFELRGCNPYSNIYLVLAASYSAIIDGIKMSVNHTTDELLKELSKDAGVEGFYLEKDRAYRSEEDVYEAFTEEERSRIFGKPPETVWENMSAFDKYPDKVKIISSGGALQEKIIAGFREGALLRWKTELISRILPEMRGIVRKAKKIHSDFVTDQDAYNWNKIFQLRAELAKDSIDEKSLFTRLITALTKGEYDKASALQTEIYDKVEELKALYDAYEKNII